MSRGLVRCCRLGAKRSVRVHALQCVFDASPKRSWVGACHLKNGFSTYTFPSAVVLASCALLCLTSGREGPQRCIDPGAVTRCACGLHSTTGGCRSDCGVRVPVCELSERERPRRLRCHSSRSQVLL